MLSETILTGQKATFAARNNRVMCRCSIGGITANVRFYNRIFGYVQRTMTQEVMHSVHATSQARQAVLLSPLNLYYLYRHTVLPRTSCGPVPAVSSNRLRSTTFGHKGRNNGRCWGALAPSAGKNAETSPTLQENARSRSCEHSDSGMVIAGRRVECVWVCRPSTPVVMQRISRDRIVTRGQGKQETRRTEAVRRVHAASVRPHRAWG
jgi:hypothetical protein